METKPIKSALRVSCYVASPVETCDRCSAGIKYVSVVHFADGVSQKFGSECINKILNQDNSLKAQFKKNSELLRRYKRYLEILSMPEDQMPIDARGYYDRGFYFVADDDGKTLCVGHNFFHPTKLDDHAQLDGSQTFDMRSCGKGAWEPSTRENWAIKCRHEIAQGRKELEGHIARIEKFLAAVLRKAQPKIEPATSDHVGQETWQSAIAEREPLFR